MSDTPAYRVDGFCPACGQKKLDLINGDITCGASLCPDPLAAAAVLRLDYRHLVEFKASTDGDWFPDWSIEHPITCRLHGRRPLDCETHAAVAEYLNNTNEPPDIGRYLVTEIDDEQIPTFGRLV